MGGNRAFGTLFAALVLRSGSLAGRKRRGTMKKGIRIAIAALAVAGVGAMAALAQNADKNTAGPTKNDYRMRVVEPAVGGVISGPTVRVVVDTRTIPEVGGEKKDVNSMPRPDVKVFLDNDQKGELKAEQNVLTIENVPAGEHKLVLVATNRSGEIIDRQEIPFRSEAVTVATTTTSSETYRAPAPAPAPVAAAPAPPPPASTYETASRELPKTASSDPLLLVGGLALIGVGLLARRATV
jgi:LPXTG-motif cell wall-anchored protein